ncbi:hypothetical protein D9Q98_006733 [Chlorella vulgaris]|uniref:ABC transporter domain-containing protein n=1 Tax=Chlorella vulgaris TaxID=3077 RepID=A0A9D4YVD1_CHLVU|nr:hypothetical protein D9Q98_006733 [Chlorella vulgaris]
MAFKGGAMPTTRTEEYVDLGFDATAMLHLGRSSLLSIPGGASTSVHDVEELIAAAKEELRRTRNAEKMATQDKAQLAKQVLPGLADRLAGLYKEAGRRPFEVTVEYRKLCVEADALVGAGNTPSLGNAFKNLLQKVTWQGGLKTANYQILKGMNGVLHPGRTTLLLGPPGSGKSVFMQALSGRLQRGPKLRVSGTIMYNGKQDTEFELRRTAAYVDQLDHHIPNMTVLETCQFAFNCLHSTDESARLLAEFGQVEERFERDLAVAEMEHAAEEGKAGTEGEMSDAPADTKFVGAMRTLVKQRAKPFVILQMLGLSDVADTIVGDSMTRGISGGQRKRVTTGEVLCGPQSLVLMDEISTGLDSATTYSVVQSFVKASHALRKTFLISLLQPAPEVVQLFDDILLLTDGHVIYHGPVDGILPFFEQQLNYVCPIRKDSGSFLQEVTTPVGQFAYATPALLERKGLAEKDRDPLTLLTNPPKALLTPVEEMEESFWRHTDSGKSMLDQLDNHPFDPESAPPGSLAKTRYGNSYLRLTQLVFLRQVLLNKRDKAFYIARALQAGILTLIIGSLYTGLSVTGDGTRQVMSISSVSVMNMAMFSSPQIALVFANKRVFYKHRDNNFFPPAAYVGSFVLTQIPQSVIECIIYSLGVYWISGLTRTAGNYFVFVVVTFSISNAMASFYRLIAFTVPSMVIANAGGGVMLLFLMISNGFSIVRTSIPVYLIWVYWMNPMAWAVRALVANELGTSRWDTPAGNGQTVGEASADAFGFYLGAQWIWASVGYSWFWLCLCSGLGVLALNVTNPPSPRPTVAEEEQKVEVQRGIFATLLKPAARGAVLASKTIKRVGSKAFAPAAAASEGAHAKAVVPFVPITLVCRDIRYYVNDPSKGTAPGVVQDNSDKEIAGKLELLKGLDLSAEPGSLTALMGGSGAGKTTLMDCILGRKTTGLIRGEILVNGHPKEQATWSRVCGYVEQQDIHSAGTTVREALQFSARLRLTQDIGMAQIHQIVDDTLEMVDMGGLRDSIVGDPGGKGLSVEQRKRLSIAVELVANPSVVFMDEPTSGLDARAAAIVMRAVKNVSLSQRTVMVTIHQPSMEIFEAFSNLVLLQRGGRLSYFGPLGVESSALTTFLEAQPGVEPIRAGYNPATWMLEVTGGSTSTTFKSSDQDFPTIYAESELCRSNRANMERLAAEGKKAFEPLRLSSTYATSWNMQRAVLTQKFFKIYWRSPNYNFVRFLMTLMIAIILGLVYLGEGDLDPAGADVATVQNIMGLIFVVCIFLGMYNLMTIQPVMSAERTVFYRERSSSYYSPGPYAIASGVVELPYLLAQSTLMVVIVYWMVGFQAVAWKFFYFLLTYFLALTMFTYVGAALVFLTPNQLLAQLLGAFMNQLWTLFAGFLVPYPNMPAGWQWMNRISPTTWILWGLAGSQLSDRDVPMEGYNGTTTVSAFMDSSFGYTFDMIWWCTLIVFSYCLVFRGLSTVMLKYVNWQRR